jgi:predicted hydrocarbon binding protein
MFYEDREEPQFTLDDIGNIEEGRPTLGSQVPVYTYRLLKYSLRDVLISQLDPQRAQDIFIEAGRVAGRQIGATIDPELDVDDVLEILCEEMRRLGMGILAVEKLDRESLNMVLTVEEDLDCSGLPAVDETVCAFDEGFLAGVLEAYAGGDFMAKELDCWANGARLCRFAVYALH